MNKRDAKIYVAGHLGLVGAAIMRKLVKMGYTQLITRSHDQMDLIRQDQVEAFFDDNHPEFVILAAAQVGGILANHTYPADFIYRNLQIQNNVVHSAYRHGIKKLLFLGSSCIYPKYAPQPMQETHLMTGELEPTNAPYAMAKIAGIEMCWSYNRQYGSRFIPVMPTNLYGPRDNFDLNSSHVLPALMRKFHLGKLAAKGDWDAVASDQGRFGAIPDDIKASLVAIAAANGHAAPDAVVTAISNLPDCEPAVILWGTGSPMRELMYVDDLADACIYLMQQPFDRLCDACAGPDKLLFNIGTGEDETIRELALTTARMVGYQDKIVWDTTKPDGTPKKLLDVTRVQKLGWHAHTSLEDGLRKTYEWYLEQSGLK